MEMRVKDLKVLMQEALDEKPENEYLLQQFLDPSNQLKRFILGNNEEAQEIIEHFDIDGVVNDFSRTTTTSCGLPVIKSTDIPNNAIVVNCSTSISPISAYLVLKNQNASVVNVIDLINSSGEVLKLPWFVDDCRKDFHENLEEYQEVFDLLADEESKQTFADVIRYRLSANINYMNKYKVRLQDQYFEDFMSYQNEIFVDAGGYDGDTTEEFVKRYPDYEKVYLFEPSEINIQKARERLKGVRDIEYVAVGLSDKCETLNFDPNAGSSSSISESAENIITAKPLDIVVTEPVSFIKMDLEGWEMKALEGCKQHIARDKPKLAIAVYHKASDFRDVPRLIRSLNSDYKIYLRHYTQGWSETVMFFI